VKGRVCPWRTHTRAMEKPLWTKTSGSCMVSTFDTTAIYRIQVCPIDCGWLCLLSWWDNPTDLHWWYYLYLPQPRSQPEACQRIVTFLWHHHRRVHYGFSAVQEKTEWNSCSITAPTDWLNSKRLGAYWWKEKEGETQKDSFESQHYPVMWFAFVIILC